jgi:hypothetical protein
VRGYLTMTMSAALLTAAARTSEVEKRGGKK